MQYRLWEGGMNYIILKYEFSVFIEYPKSNQKHLLDDRKQISNSGHAFLLI